jgi:hypothetical protein
MPIVRRKLDENTVYPSNLRYNPDTDTVQTNVNGDWVDSPDADPRNQTIFPPRLTADPACDGAQSVVDALQNQISGIIDAIEAASTLFTIAGLILGLFTFGTFDIFISLALTIGGAMVDAGAPSLETALTPATFDTLKCILFCHFESNGRIGDTALTEAMADVTDQIGGLGAFVINAMLALAGAGGVNNLAALGTSTGDCSLCECGCGDEEIAFSMVIYYGTEISRTGCRLVASSLPEASHEAIGMTWDGTHPWQLTQETLSGDPHHSHWQWYTWDGSEHGPFTGFSAPLNTTVTTISMSSDNGEPEFTATWTVRTPPP